MKKADPSALVCGKAFKMAQRKCYGYDVGADGALVVTPNESSVVRWIFDRYADIEVLPGDAIADLLDRDTVWPDGRLEVSLKFTDELPALAGTGWKMKAAE